ncbi:MAG: glutamyl-tRNA reductase [Cyclobacteriaceae bacterium]|nr:glutamyl-tRNA reductase [Cyclobacteriaceae bacterium]
MESVVNLKSIGLSYVNAPVDLRERVALNEKQTGLFMDYIKDYSDISDLLVISTCNRTEIFYSHESDRSDLIISGLCLVTKLSKAEAQEYFINNVDNNTAIERLYRISLGLESQIIGDLQITNQIKSSYQLSADRGLAGPYLHRLMHSIFYANKRVVQETAFRDGAASVSYVAKEIAEDIASGIVSPVILVYGLGEMGEDVARNLAASKSELSVFLANRTTSKAVALAEELNFKYIDADSVLDFAKYQADIIISAASTETPLFTLDNFSNLELLSYKYFIDLSVPRSVDKGIEQLTGMVLYDIDEIKDKSSKTFEKRKNAIGTVEEIIKESIADFNNWAEEMIVSPIIKKLKNALEEIRKEEMERYLKKANDKEAALLDKASKSMMQKIIKLPVLHLKAACKRGEAETLIDILNDLFNLEETETSKINNESQS